MLVCVTNYYRIFELKENISDIVGSNHMIGAVAEKSTAVLPAAGSISARNIYLYGLQMVVSGLGVCAYELNVCKRTYDTRFI